MLNWTTTREDEELITQIMARVDKLFALDPERYRTTRMDITACHCNGCPLDLNALL